MKLKKKLKHVLYRIHAVEKGYFFEYDTMSFSYRPVSDCDVLALLQECERRCPRLRYRLRWMIWILETQNWQGSWDMALSYSYKGTLRLCLESL